MRISYAFRRSVFYPHQDARGPGNELWITVFDDSKVARYTVTP